jgi:hypothetical protein
MGMEMPADPLKQFFVPKHAQLSACVELGSKVGQALKAKC